MFKRKPKICGYVVAMIVLVVIYLAAMSTIMVVYADTDGNELRITSQPDKLTLYLGEDLAGAAFELKLDTGVFPVPVTANSSGVLTMELGGSKEYTLTRLASDPQTGQPDEKEADGSTEQDPVEPYDPILMAPSEKTVEVPIVQLVVFLCGLILALGGLLVMRVIKKRREYSEDEYDDNDE